ncbi:hypothetical protein ACQ4PT_032929 [Festuca glaucescens]
MTSTCLARATTSGRAGTRCGGAGLVNKTTAANIRHVLPELLAENLVRGRGLLCLALIKSQAACPAFTDVFAALAAAVNSKLPIVGRLLVVRLALRVSRSCARDDKPQLAAAASFVAHLVNQGVAHELLALEILETLLATPTEGGVEVAVGLVKECGATLHEACPRLLDAVFDGLRGILHDGSIGRRTEFMIEGLFAVRKAQFRAHPPVRPELDLVELEDQLTHQVELSGHGLDPETHLDVFSPSATFLQDEAAYERLKRSMLGDDDDDELSSSDDDEAQVVCGDDEDMEEVTMIKDETATELVGLRMMIYLTIMSSAGAEEAGHKLLSIVRPGQEMELCAMVIECCRQERTYTRYYGLLAQGLCAVDQAYQAGFEACFARVYATAHCMDTTEVRGTARLYAHLLATDAVSWRGVLAGRVRLAEEDTTSSSRIFVKVLFQELSEQLRVPMLGRRMTHGDPAVRDALFPTDSAKNTRFAVNFFTAIGLGGVTEQAREHLRACAMVDKIRLILTRHVI